MQNGPPQTGASSQQLRGVQRAETALAALEASMEASAEDLQRRAADAEGLSQRLQEAESERGDLLEQVNHLQERCRGLEANIR